MVKISDLALKLIITTTCLLARPCWAAEKDYLGFWGKNPLVFELKSAEFKEDVFSEEELSSNFAYVSPKVFRELFSNAPEHGYLRLYQEYKEKDKYNRSISEAKGVLGIKPHEGIKDNNLYLSSDLKQFIESIESKKKSLEFIPVSERLNSLRSIKLGLTITSTASDKNKITLSYNDLGKLFRKKFLNVPVTGMMSKLVFRFTPDEIRECEGLKTLAGLLIVSDTDRSGCIDIGTNVQFECFETPGIELNRIYSSTDPSFKNLRIKEKIFSSDLGLLLQPKTREMETTDFLKEISIEEELKDPSPPKPQIRHLDLDFSKFDIGGLDEELEELFRRAVLTRGVSPEVLTKLGIKEHAKGIILYGPPGTGKTLIARNIAKMLGVDENHFTVVNGPELLDKFVGESEKNLKRLFEKAENNPDEFFILFFDEIDSLAKKRSSGDGAESSVSNNLVNMFLTKMDGAKGGNNILVIGATNRPDMIDVAFMRPGRFGIKIEIGLPDEKGRESIFNVHLKAVRENKVLAADFDMAGMVKRSRNYTGAEIKGVCDEARNYALQGAIKDPENLNEVDMDKLIITNDHFLAAFERINPLFGHNLSSIAMQLSARSINLPSQQDLVDRLIYKIKSFRCGDVSSILITGAKGSGKSAIAGSLADQMQSSFDLTRVLTPNMLNVTFAGQLEQAWQDAKAVSKALIIIDGLEFLTNMLNDYKADDKAMITLNKVLNSKVKGQITVLATMGTKAYGLFQRQNSILEWSQHETTSDLSRKDIEFIVKSFGIALPELPDLLMSISLAKVLDIVSVKEAKDFTLQEWKKHIELLA